MRVKYTAIERLKSLAVWSHGPFTGYSQLEPHAITAWVHCKLCH